MPGKGRGGFNGCVEGVTAFCVCVFLFRFPLCLVSNKSCIILGFNNVRTHILGETRGEVGTVWSFFLVSLCWKIQTKQTSGEFFLCLKSDERRVTLLLLLVTTAFKLLFLP